MLWLWWARKEPIQPFLTPPPTLPTPQIPQPIIQINKSFLRLLYLSIFLVGGCGGASGGAGVVVMVVTVFVRVEFVIVVGVI